MKSINARSEKYMSDIPLEIDDLLRKFTPPQRWSRISSNARLLHDLLILGDEILAFWNAFDPGSEIDMTGFNVDEYFPHEASAHSFLITVLSNFGAEERITKRYKKLPVSALLQLKESKSWGVYILKSST
jgi:hypothetical protein